MPGPPTQSNDQAGAPTDPAGGAVTLDLLDPSCNLQTVTDGRGAILTWLPDDAIREFNMVLFRPGATRGNHYHPEFVEYLLVVSGRGVLVWRDGADGADQIVPMSAGQCARIPRGLIHAFHAVTETTCMAMITKPWDACDVPYVKVGVIEPPAAGERSDRPG